MCQSLISLAFCLCNSHLAVLETRSLHEQLEDYERLFTFFTFFAPFFQDHVKIGHVSGNSNRWLMALAY